MKNGKILCLAALASVVVAFMLARRHLLSVNRGRDKSLATSMQKPRASGEGAIPSESEAGSESEQGQEKREQEKARTLVRQGEARESHQDWAGALKCYHEAWQILNDEKTAKRAQAMQHIQAGDKLEAKEKWGEAAAAYKQGAPDCFNKEFVRKRIDYCGSMDAYLQFYAQGKELAGGGRWDEAAAAYGKAKSLAAKLGLKSDIDNRLKGLEGARKREKRMARLLTMLDQQGKHRALLLACAYYAANPELAYYAKEIAALRARTERAIADELQGKPVMRRDTTFDFIRLKSGAVYRGRILGKKGEAYEFEIMESGRSAKALLPVRAVEDKWQSKVTGERLMREDAKRLLEAALDALKAKKTLGAMERIGRLTHDYADTPYVKKMERLQKQRFRTKVPELVGVLGDTLALVKVRIVSLAEDRADFLAHLCPSCKGSGMGACPKCGGKGVVSATCPLCRGSKRVICPRCHGHPSGICPTCHGSGRIRKRVASRIIDPHLGLTYTYKSARCKRCGGDGRISCKKCKGKGTIVCPKCRGKGTVAVTCDVCGGAGKVKCQKCNGVGRMPGED